MRKHLVCLLLLMIFAIAAYAEGKVSLSTEPIVPRSGEPSADAAVPTDEPTDAPAEEPTPEPGAPTELPEDPQSTPVPEGLVLTIRYVNADGSAVAPDYVQYGLKEGDAYSVESPQVQGMMADQTAVAGVMGNEDQVIVVTYKMGGAHGGRPGGFPGSAARPSMGEIGMTEQKAIVTPGEALTDIHTSGDCTMNRYGALRLTGDTGAPLLTDEGAAPQILLMNGDETMPYAAQAQEDVLILTGEAGVWHIGGDALRQMADSGFAYVRLVCGEAIAQMPVREYASGYTWDRLQMQGLPSAQFVYGIDPENETLNLSVGSDIYAADEICMQIEYGQKEAK